MKRRSVNWVLSGVTVASALGLALANEDPMFRDLLCRTWCPSSQHPDFWNSIVFSLAVGALTSVFFYILLVELPASSQKRKLKRSLLSIYDEFRRECITQLLFSINGTASLNTVDELLDPNKLKEYFYGDPWSKAANEFNYNDQKRYLDDTINAVRTFKVELDFFLSQSDIDDERSFERLKRLSIGLEHISRTEREYDSIKVFFRELWSIMTGWSFVDGQYGRDRIRELIEAA